MSLVQRGWKLFVMVFHDMKSSWGKSSLVKCFWNPLAQFHNLLLKNIVYVGGLRLSSKILRERYYFKKVDTIYYIAIRQTIWIYIVQSYWRINSREIRLYFIYLIKLKLQANKTVTSTCVRLFAKFGIVVINCEWFLPRITESRIFRLISYSVF